MTTRTRMPLILGLVFMALLLLALVGTTAVSFPLWFRYRNATGLGAARTVAQIAAGLAAAGFFVAAAIVAIATALRPASRWRKLLYVLPAYLLVFTLAGVLLYLLGIGTVGAFTTIWIAAGGLLGMIAVVIATARMPLSAQTAKRAITTLGISGALSALAWLAMVTSLAIVLTSQPSAATGGQNGLPGASGAQAVPTAAAGDPATGQAQQEPGPGGGGRQSSTTLLLIGVALITVFGVIAWVSIARGWRAASEPSDPAQAAARVDYRHEAGRAVFSGIAITIVGLAVAQLVPIAHDNPPVQTAVQWDSPQTQKLAQRACMDCHSNATTWPWYAYVAPGSWLLRNHVSEGRAQLNLSELNNAQPFRAARLPEDAAQQIRNGAMPPADYLILHSEARLSDAEKQQLIQGIQQSLANSLTK
jgi:hypothetical protein